MEKLYFSPAKSTVKTLKAFSTKTNKSEKSSYESLFFCHSAISSTVNFNTSDITENRQRDILDSYVKDFRFYFKDLMQFYHLDNSLIKNFYMLDVYATTSAFCILKYCDEIEQYLLSRKLNKVGFTKSKQQQWIDLITITRKDIVELLFKQGYEPKDIISKLQKITASTENLYEIFINWKNSKILTRARLVLEELQLANRDLIRLKARISLSAARVTADELTVTEELYYNDWFDQIFYIEEEQPYHLEARVLRLIAPVWEVKVILDYRKSGEEIEQLLTNKEIKVFHEICQRLKSYNTISPQFQYDVKLFYTTAIEMLRNRNKC